nr:LacI family DNA-binding transcriptional regulator [uncultured Mediterraneibacter sp.]
MSSSVSIKEIAELAGVSIATVSRVVNQKGGYSAATEERVRSIIQKTCYAQGAIARGAQNEKKAVIGLMVPDILNEHFTEMTLEIQKALSRKGYLTMICNWDESLELEKKYLEMMIQQQVSGLILVSGADGNLDTKGIPTVYVDRRPEEEVSDGHVFVESDNPYGGYLATRELIRQGCKKIVFLTDMQQESSKITRYQGYCRALTEAGLELNPSLILQVERIDIDVAREVITDALKRGLMFDGIMCTTDILAVASEVAVEKYGLRVPEDIKITGYDDTPITSLLRIPITSVNQNRSRLAEKATDLLSAMIEGKEIENGRYVVPVNLVERKSTGK